MQCLHVLSITADLTHLLISISERVNPLSTKWKTTFKMLNCTNAKNLPRNLFKETIQINNKEKERTYTIQRMAHIANTSN